MKVVLNKPSLAGRVQVPCSKSIAHRALICRHLAGGGELHNLTWNEDLRATEAALISLSSPEQPRIIDCGASASTLRFMIPQALVKGRKTIFTGKERLGRRPLDPYINMMDNLGIKYSTGEVDDLPLTVEGRLENKNLTIAGNVSSQFVSGLMMALPLLSGESSITVRDRLESAPYVDMTTWVLNYYGIFVDVYYLENGIEYYIPEGQKFRPRDLTIEGDFSLAAVWLAAGFLGNSPIRVGKLPMFSWQGDFICQELFMDMGGKISQDGDDLLAYPSSLHGIEMDAKDCPDLVPVVAVLGCLAKGRTRIYNAARLRLKESDRLASLVTELSKLGAKIRETRDGLEIEGVDMFKGDVVLWGHADHRIVMAMALASLRCEGKVTIRGADAVKKSYPAFWKDWQALGGNIA